MKHTYYISCVHFFFFKQIIYVEQSNRMYVRCTLEKKLTDKSIEHI